MWGGVVVLWARRSRRQRALVAAMAYSGEAERWARAELATLLLLHAWGDKGGGVENGMRREELGPAAGESPMFGVGN
jgi:hypothetical protein